MFTSLVKDEAGRKNHVDPEVMEEGQLLKTVDIAGIFARLLDKLSEGLFTLTHPNTRVVELFKTRQSVNPDDGNGTKISPSCWACRHLRGCLLVSGGSPSFW